MSDESKRNWWSVYPLWIKFCGVWDEYVSLKSKWKYITSIQGLSALPNFDETFTRIDELIKETYEEFQPMFNRLKLDETKTFRADLAEIKLSDIQKRLYSLTHYLGILKFVFFQRTVSFEIPEVTSGLPLSPERTTGNEAIYLAADNIARRYLDCINVDPRLKWDGTVSFIYPVQESYFFGGYSWPDKYLNHFHILLSEENKHFLGSFLILAHEVSHAGHFIIKEEGFHPNWLNEMWRRVAGYQIDNFHEDVLKLEESCHNCYIWGYLYSLLGNLLHNSEEFLQFVADLIALMIGGPTTFFALVDMFINSAEKGRYIPLRPAFLHGYCLQSGLKEYSSLLQKEILKMVKGWSKYVPIFAPNCPYMTSTPCYELLNKIGELSGKIFAYSESKLLKDLRTELPTESITFPSGVDSIISAIVREKFDITPDVENRICNHLLERRTCAEEDPRYILHCYYTLFRKETVPDYATTLYSLAYNTFRKNGGRG